MKGHGLMPQVSILEFFLYYLQLNEILQYFGNMAGSHGEGLQYGMWLKHSSPDSAQVDKITS